MSVEWLYRWSRIGRIDTEDYQGFERRMLFGKKEEREGMKTKIFNLERNAPQFLYFNPTDDRKPNPLKPEPQEQQKEQTPKSKNSSTQQSKQKSNLTPGEFESIKAYEPIPTSQKTPNLPYQKDTNINATERIIFFFRWLFQFNS